MSIIDKLSKALLLDEKTVMHFASTSPHKYKVYEIPKRNGTGHRTIAQPSKALKYVQSLIVDQLEDILLLHESAYAYRKGIGIKDNAHLHSKSKYLLKMDFKDFFNSITPELFFRVAAGAGLSFDPKDRLILTGFLFWREEKKSDLILSIGAPSSPLISNFVMFLFDNAISLECQKRDVIYSRYADDITFSTNQKGLLFDFPEMVKTVLDETTYGFITINQEKLVFSSKKHNRHVTGVTIANDGKLSIGRDRKRLISSMIHKFSMGELPTDRVAYLQGMLSYASHIEPDFYYRMQKKYGDQTLNNLNLSKITTRS